MSVGTCWVVGDWEIDLCLGCKLYRLLCFVLDTVWSSSHDCIVWQMSVGMCWVVGDWEINMCLCCKLYC